MPPALALKVTVEFPETKEPFVTVQLPPTTMVGAPTAVS